MRESRFVRAGFRVWASARERARMRERGRRCAASCGQVRVTIAYRCSSRSVAQTRATSRMAAPATTDPGLRAAPAAASAQSADHKVHLHDFLSSPVEHSPCNNDRRTAATFLCSGRNRLQVGFQSLLPRPHIRSQYCSASDDMPPRNDLAEAPEQQKGSTQ